MTILYGGCNQSFHNEKLVQFNEFLGSEKAEVLDKSVNHFQTFLGANYPHQTALVDKTTAFLTELNLIYESGSRSSLLNPEWVIDSDLSEELLQEYAESGLRQEIWLFGFEIREIEEKAKDNSYELEEDLYDLKQKVFRDSLLNFNHEGKYLNGLRNYAINNWYLDELFEYESTMLSFPSPGVLIPSLLENDINLSDPFIQRVIFTDIFIIIMDEDLKRNGRMGSGQVWSKTTSLE